MGEFVRSLRPDTLLVSIMHANNETGVVFPVEKLARVAKETDPSILFHTDATQTMGKLPIDLTGEFKHVDLLSFSGHKLYAPKGVGALFIRRGTPCRPLLLGGHQENGRRGGTENVAFIVGLARALEVALAGHEEDEARIRALRDRLETELADRIPWVQVNGGEAPRLSNTLECLRALHRGRGHALPALRPRHLRLERLGLHLRFPGALPRDAGDEGALHRGPRLGAVQPGPLQHRGRRGTASSRSSPRSWRASAASSPYWDVEHNRPRGLIVSGAFRRTSGSDAVFTSRVSKANGSLSTERRQWSSARIRSTRTRAP